MTAAERQRDYAGENDAIASRLDAAGQGRIAEAYREAARKHRECAERLEKVTSRDH